MKKFWVPWVVGGVIFSLGLAGFGGTGVVPTVFADSSAVPGSNGSPTQNLYLPLVMRNYPLVTVFGADARSDLDKVEEAGLSWARGAMILWEQVEATKGVYNWNDDGLKAFLAEAAQRNIQVILIVQRAPTWARKYTKACGPIKSSELDSFAKFVSEVVKRYSVPPYNVRYFQIWNEQDAPTGVPDDIGIGCWGEQSYAGDPYNGGEYFGEMLKKVYPKVKEVNPGAQVVAGALLLDCDPRGVGMGYCPDSDPNSDYHPSKWNFAEGMIRNGAAFDILAFNGYAYYAPGKTGVWQERKREKWAASGGAVDGKLNYLRSLLNKYGVNKPIMLTEAGIFYGSSLNDGPTTPEYEQEKADYLVYVFANTWAQGLQATIWYSLKHLSPKLLDASNNPRPAYNALKTMTGILAQADYKGREDQAGYAKFIYHLGNQEIWLLIPTGEIAGTNYNISKPSNFVKLVDIYGNQLPDPGSTITFNRPTYVFRNR
ncbi:MAG: hypothetical protein RML93_08710 [Anaerolineales bacterium]|nr:hypothetical protein [Anaerolineales bacterium]MCS7248494.1 hypothetical protein [Anaerolineales bacterium]MDW8162307.1 hypothetical protein [Anaerolineales bacterium]MDW8447356.1 hypothetical protein [Anaerolineales bacterium]